MTKDKKSVAAAETAEGEINAALVARIRDDNERILLAAAQNAARRLAIRAVDLERLTDPALCRVDYQSILAIARTAENMLQDVIRYAERAADAGGPRMHWEKS